MLLAGTVCEGRAVPFRGHLFPQKRKDWARIWELLSATPGEGALRRTSPIGAPMGAHGFEQKAQILTTGLLFKTRVGRKLNAPAAHGNDGSFNLPTTGTSGRVHTRNAARSPN